MMGLAIAAASYPVRAETVISVTQVNYDNMDRIQCTAQRMNSTLYGSLPTSACTASTEGADGPDRITKTSYDAVGQITDIKKALGSGPIDLR